MSGSCIKALTPNFGVACTGFGVDFGFTLCLDNSILLGQPLLCATASRRRRLLLGAAADFDRPDADLRVTRGLNFNLGCGLAFALVFTFGVAFWFGLGLELVRDLDCVVEFGFDRTLACERAGDFFAKDMGLSMLANSWKAFAAIACCVGDDLCGDFRGADLDGGFICTGALTERFWRLMEIIGSFTACLSLTIACVASTKREEDKGLCDTLATEAA